MALQNPALPFGLRDITLRPIAADGSVGAGVDLPVARTLSFSDTESVEELMGDDQTVAAHGAGPTVDWELEAGGISLAAYKVIAGGTNTTSGTTPNLKMTFSKTIFDARPYFQIEGQAISDSGGDLHGLIYRCKATGDIEGSMENGAFLLTHCTGKGYGRASDGKLYDFIQNESVVAIVP